MGWLNPPPVVAVSGPVALLRRREIEKAIRGARRKKRRIEWVSGETAELDTLMASTVFFDDEKLLIIISEPDKLDPEKVLAHSQSGDTQAVWVLNYDGTLRKNSKLFKLLQKHSILHMTYSEPEPWKAEGWAVKFLVKEAKAHKKVLPEPLAKAMIRICGTDLGLLSFEMLKLNAYLNALGETEIKPEHVRGTLAVLTEASLFPLVDAVSQANEAAVLKQLANIERTHNGDPTMRVCAMLASSITSWLHAAGELKSGMGAEEAARSVGTSVARMRRSMMPAVSQWGESGLIDLMKVVTGVERAVKTGRANPWMLLQARLAASCRDSRASG